MDWRTELHILPSQQKLNHSQAIMLLGSCFSQTMGDKLGQYKFEVSSNPFGTVFNPISIGRLLDYACKPDMLDAEQLLCSHGTYVHPDFYRTLGAEKKEKAAENIKQAVISAHHFLTRASFLFITLGTSTAFKLVSSDKVVANCHKLPGNLFEKVMISPEDGFMALSDAIGSVFSLNSNLNIVFTVSPVRHIKDGIIENSRSKARLLVMVEKLMLKFPAVQYFPSYEWMMDDLRDYRYYASDLIHPNDMAIQYLWEKFTSHYLDSETMEINNLIEKITRACLHRPSFPRHETYQKLISETLLSINKLEEKFPTLNFNEEKNILKARQILD